MLYPNGQWPLTMFEELGRGVDKYGTYRHLAPPGTAARWRELCRLAFEKYGVVLLITPGWNVYRPLIWQKVYRNDLGIYAAIPGTSSHGMVYNGGACCAIDVYNWAALAPGNRTLAWSRFVALCRLVGFTVDFVKPRELWHIGDFNPLTVPAFAAIKINPLTTAMPPKEDDMAYPVTINKTHRFLLAPGYVKHFDNVAASDLTKNIVSAADTWIDLTADSFLKQLDSFGVPRWSVDHVNGGVLDVTIGKVVKGGMWSWARQADHKTSAVLAKLDQMGSELPKPEPEVEVVVESQGPLPVDPNPAEPAGGWPTGGYLATNRLVIDIQKLLGITADGRYGPATSQAVARWQAARWLTADGIWGVTSDGLGFPPAWWVHGVDYSFARPDIPTMKNRGIRLAGRYLWAPKYTDGRTNKGIDRPEYDTLKTNGIMPFFIYEEDGKELRGGFDAGVRVAKAAEGFLGNLGLAGFPVYFNVDYDAPAADMPAILEALKGVASVIGLERTGLYAGFGPVKAAFDAGLIRWGFQTYAWSGGRWDSRAQLQQWSNGQWGGTIDFTRAVAPQFGQNPV